MAQKRRFLDVWIVESNTVYQEVPFEVVTDWVQQGRLLADDQVKITWGDASMPDDSSAVPAGEGFDIWGTHTYDSSGSYHVSVDIYDLDGNLLLTMQATINVLGDHGGSAHRQTADQQGKECKQTDVRQRLSFAIGSTGTGWKPILLCQRWELGLQLAIQAFGVVLAIRLLQRLGG